MDTPEERPAHSPLGASGAERWMNCPGSVALLKELEIEETSDEPTYRKEGTAMHAAAEHCLREGVDTWQITGQTFGGVVIDAPMAQAVQAYLDVVRKDVDLAAFHYVEFPVSSPVHPSFYGTLDFGAIIGRRKNDQGFLIPDLVIVTDLKGGEGIIVEPEENPQEKYYAFGLIDAHPYWPDDTKVILRIVQPRAVHALGIVREWETDVGAIREWVHDTLVPAMARTEYDHTLDAGEHCRFCPAKLVCPLLTSLFRAAATCNPKEIVNLSDESIGRSYKYIEAVKFYLKALGEDTERRLLKGHEVDGAKLVKKKSNRVLKEGAEAIARARFGDEAFTKPELKSPPALEAISPAAKEWVREWAYSPDTGLTVAPEHDPRPEVVVRRSSDTFAGAIAALKE